MIGEIKTLRALAYFYLVRTYKEVPFITDATVSDDQNFNKAKSSEDHILDALITDLVSAERVVRSTFESTKYSKGRITKNAVRALLADIYLWRNEYQSCVSKCNEILADTTIRLVQNFSDNLYNTVFVRGNSRESIFELQYSNDIQWNEATKAYYGTAGNAKDQAGELYAPDYIVTAGSSSPFAFEIGPRKKESEYDKRRYYNINVSTSSGTNYIFKYAGSNWNMIGNITSSDRKSVV